MRATTTDTDSDRQDDVLYRALKTLRGSLLLSMVAVSVVTFLIGVVFETSIKITQQDGVIAGMLGVFGISGVLAGGSFYVALKLFQRR